MTPQESIPSPLQLHVNTLRAMLADTSDVLKTVLDYADEESRFNAQLQCEAIDQILTGAA